MEEYTEKHLWSILRKIYLNVMQKKDQLRKCSKVHVYMKLILPSIGVVKMNYSLFWGSIAH